MTNEDDVKAIVDARPGLRFTFMERSASDAELAAWEDMHADEQCAGQWRFEAIDGSEKQAIDRIVSAHNEAAARFIASAVPSSAENEETEIPGDGATEIVLTGTSEAAEREDAAAAAAYL